MGCRQIGTRPTYISAAFLTYGIVECKFILMVDLDRLNGFVFVHPCRLRDSLCHSPLLSFILASVSVAGRFPIAVVADSLR